MSSLGSSLSSEGELIGESRPTALQVDGKQKRLSVHEKIVLMNS